MRKRMLAVWIGCSTQSNGSGLRHVMGIPKCNDTITMTSAGRVSAQDEHELGAVFVGHLAALLALVAEAALLQDADRGDVVLGHVRVEGTLGHEVQESGERAGRDTLASA